MRMYFLHSTITLLVVIAHVHCGTLRQYGPDWLIPKPAPQIDPKRITAKSVFIAPNFQTQNVRCASGFREDASGRCVKFVHVNQAAQLDFLLQRLNAMYGAPIVSHSEKQPLQVAVEIPVEPVEGASMPPTEEMYSQGMVPEGEFSVDLLQGTLNLPDYNEDTTTENANKDPNFQSVTVKQPLDEAGLTPVLPVFANESEDNETDFVFKPNKEFFQVDEEPVVTLTYIESDDDEDYNTENTTVQSENVTHIDNILPEEKLPLTLLSVHSEDAGVMANIMKNASNVVKKETSLGDTSIQFTPESVGNETLGTNLSTKHTFNETHLNLTGQNTTVHSEQIVQNKNEQVSDSSNHSADNILQSISTEYAVKTESESEAEITDKVPATSSDIKIPTSPNSTTSNNFPTGTSTSIHETPSESPTEVPATEVLTSQQSTTHNSSEQAKITHESTTQDVTTQIPTLATIETNNASTGQLVKDHMWEASGEGVENVNHSTNEDEYDDKTQDVDVEADIPPGYASQTTGGGYSDYDVLVGDKLFPENVPQGSADHSLVLSSNNSVKVDSSNITTGGVGDNERIHVVKNDSELEENEDIVKTNVSSTSNITIEKTEPSSGINVPTNNVTNFEELLSASQTTSTGVTISPNISGESVLQHSDQEVLRADSTIPNVEIRPYELQEVASNVSQQVQEHSVITPQHTVHVVYPQPIIQVMKIKQDPQAHPIDIANHNDHSTVFKGNAPSNSPPIGLQLHNLNPIPNTVHNTNFNPLPQMPLVEKAPELPPKYGGYPYPPLPPLTEVHRPSIPSHRPPYPQHNPYPIHSPPLPQYPPDNLNHNSQSGFVRFPTDSVAHKHHTQGDEVNTVRFPQEDVRSNGKYSRWGNNWRFDETRGQRPQQQFWAGGHETQYPQGTNRRNYWVDNRPNRRRLQHNYY